jgi:Uncharacterized conserved protein
LSIYGLDEKQLETEIMSIGAVGSKEWLQTADEINSDAEEIYKKRGQKQPLVVNLKKRDDLLKGKSQKSKINRLLIKEFNNSYKLPRLNLNRMNKFLNKLVMLRIIYVI